MIWLIPHLRIGQNRDKRTCGWNGPPPTGPDHTMENHRMADDHVTEFHRSAKGAEE